MLAPPLKTKFNHTDVEDMLKDVIALFEPQALLKKLVILVMFSVPVLFINYVQVQLKSLFINILKTWMPCRKAGI
jgi:uncharacterized protein YqgQ